MSSAMQEQAYKSGVLDKHEHGRLVQEIESVARRAGIPVQMVWTSMKDICSEDELEYVRQLRRKSPEGVYGLVYVGKSQGVHSILDRMSAVAAACVRNYINAQVMNVNDVIRNVQAGTMPEPTVLCIPNFYIGAEADIPQWRSGALLDMLYSRQQSGLQTFLYVKDMDGLKSDYGESFAEHLNKFEKTQA